MTMLHRLLISGLLIAIPAMSQMLAPHAMETARLQQHANTHIRDDGPSDTASLGYLVREALARNPAIKSAIARVEAQRARVPQARALPDPTVSMGWMGWIAPFAVMHGDPSSYRGLTVSETFPFPAKLTLGGQLADREAEAAWWNFEDMRRTIIAEVKEAYYQFFYVEQATSITKKDQDLLQKLERIAQARYQVGSGIQQDVIRAQIELSKLHQQLIVLRQQEQTARVRLNTLLDRDPESPLETAAALDQSPFTYSLEDLYALARKNAPGLEESERMIEANQYAVNLAEKAYNPALMVSYNYWQRPGMPDMHGIMVGINIPVFYKSKQREGVIEAANKLNSAREEQENRLTTITFEVKQYYLAAKASEALINLYSKALVPQSSLALESSMSSYEVGKLDFLSMIENFQNVLDYEINYYHELSAFEIALAHLEPLVGVELTK